MTDDPGEHGQLESWQFYEIDRETDPAVLASLELRLLATLGDVRASVADWSEMRRRAREVAAHLDGNRRSALYQAILGLRAQAWLTGTDEHLFHALGPHARWFTIEAARVIPHGQE